MSITEKKIVFINASTVKISGGLIQAINYIETLIEHSNFEIILLCPSIIAYKTFRNKIRQVIFVPKFFLIRMFRWILDFYFLPKKISQIKPDLVLSLGNLPAICTFPQVYLHDNPFLTHEIPKSLYYSMLQKLILKYRIRFTKNRLKYVSKVWCQSTTEKNLFKIGTKYSGKIEVVEPLIPSYLFRQNCLPNNLPKKPNGSIRLICLSNYFKHKNINFLIRVIQHSIKKKIKLQILFTLENKSGNQCSSLISNIKQLPNEAALNIGHVETMHINSIISSCDGVILPSLMETFGLNCFDAWLNKKPYFISDFSYNQENCKNGAVYFDPNSAEDCLNKITSAFDNEDKISNLIMEGNSIIENWQKQESIISKLENAFL